MQKENFDKCNHEWVLHLDADQTITSTKGNSLFRCIKCNHFITFLEKIALDGLQSDRDSLKIQEGNTRISMEANVIAAATLIITALTLFFGEKIVQYLN